MSCGNWCSAARLPPLTFLPPAPLAFLQADAADSVSEDEAAEAGARAPAAAGASGTSASDTAGHADASAAAGVYDPNPSYTNKQRVLVFCSRGITARYRHLMEDLRALIPHHKKDSKLDSKDNLSTINEIAEIKSCGSTVFFEVRKKRDLYLWFSKTPSGPSIKFHVVNVHTMDELRLAGNCLKGSRPLLSFDKAFDSAPHLALMKEMFIQVFNVPRGHPKSQPFHDHVLGFYVVDGRVWLRHYQIVDATQDAKALKKLLAAGEEPASLVEVGPRCVLTPVRIFAGSFGGPTLYQNPLFVSPNRLRHEARKMRGAAYADRQAAQAASSARAAELARTADPLDRMYSADAALGGDGDLSDGEAGDSASGSDSDEEDIDQ